MTDMNSRRPKSSAQATEKAEATAIDEIKVEVADAKKIRQKSFELLRKRADAVDAVLMENGDPEYDCSSG